MTYQILPHWSSFGIVLSFKQNQECNFGLVTNNNKNVESPFNIDIMAEGGGGRSLEIAFVLTDLYNLLFTTL